MPSGIRESLMDCLRHQGKPDGAVWQHPRPLDIHKVAIFRTGVGRCCDCAESHDAPCRNPQELMPADTSHEAIGGVGVGQDHVDALLGRRPRGLETSPSKQDLWLRNPNSYTSLHLEPRQDVQVCHQMRFLC